MEEKRIKGGSRRMKITLIESFNPRWDDIWKLDVSRW
jgi:predicted GIY-YIG superfamily endonuclease